jgi:tRNA(Glu) U13 pseudouridine synthase TruD
MSESELKRSWEETVKSVKELVRAVTKATHEQLNKTTPKVVNALDESIKKASKDLSDTLQAIDRRGAREQIQLLSAYQSFLQKQIEMIEGKIRALKEKTGS